MSSGFNTSRNLSILSSTVSGGRLLLKGENLHNIRVVSSQSANLSGYKMEIESLNENTATIKLTHSSSSALNLAIGTILTFVISTAHADTTINLTVDVAPTGAVMAFNLSSCPAGWSAMDGSGGRPDARGRTVIGSGTGSGLTNRTLASVGGSETHVLTLAQMPAHTHAATLRTFSDVGVSGSPAGNYLASAMAGLFDTTHDTSLAPDSVDVAVQGSGTPHPNMQPYVAMLYCQKN